MIKKIFSTLFKSVKKTTDSVGKSMDFIDDVLEKEYITSTIENIKESTGDAVEKAGMIYQKTKDTITENVNIEKIKDGVEDIIEKGKEKTSELADDMLEKSDTLKNVMQEGEDLVKKIIGEEE